MAKDVDGLTKVLKNLAKNRASFELGTSRGLRKGGLMLQRASQLEVPVRFGNLKASAFTRAQGRGLNTVVVVGYTAAYAVHVHEATEEKLKGQPRAPDPNNPGAVRGNYWDPAGRGKSKFLEDPVKKIGPGVRALIVKEIQRVKSVK